MDSTSARPPVTREAEPQPAARAPAAAAAVPDPTARELLSLHKPVKADVRGNLADPQVITSPVVEDWLKDRWQAAKDMSGTPIPGKHWVEIDLGRPCLVNHVVVDWETAYCEAYHLQGRLTDDEHDPFHDMPATDHNGKVSPVESRRDPNPPKKHVIDSFDVEDLGEGHDNRLVRHVCLRCDRPATQWGVSIWRLELYGWCAPAES